MAKSISGCQDWSPIDYVAEEIYERAKNWEEESRKFEARKPKLKPSDFYRDEKYTTDDSPHYTLRYQNFPMIGEILESVDYGAEIKGLEIRNHFADCPDGRRGLWISSWWFNNKPFALTYKYGRDGDDGGNEHITDREVFKSLVSYLLTLRTNEDRSIRFDSEEDLMIPMEIYGYDLSRFKK